MMKIKRNSRNTNWLIEILKSIMNNLNEHIKDKHKA